MKKDKNVVSGCINIENIHINANKKEIRIN